MPPASMRHYRQIAPIQKSRVRSIDAAHTAETCTIPDERHRGGLLQQSEKRAGCSSSLPPRGRELDLSDCSREFYSKQADTPRLAENRGAALCRLAQADETDGTKWGPSKTAPQLALKQPSKGVSSCCKLAKSRSVSPIWSKPSRKRRRPVTPTRHCLRSSWTALINSIKKPKAQKK